MDSMGLLPKISSCNQFVLLIINCYKLIMREVPTSKATASHIASLFMDSLVTSYLFSRYVLTDTGTQFNSSFFESLCAFLGMKLLTTTACHLWTTWKAECLNKMIMARHRHYLAEHQKDWDTWGKAVSYAYSAHVHRTTNATPFRWVSSCHPPGPTTFDNPMTFPIDATAATSPHTLNARLLQYVRTMCQDAIYRTRS